MDLLKHIFFVGLYDDDDDSIDLVVWMMNRFYYQRRWLVIDNVVATHGVVAAVDFALAADNDNYDRRLVYKFVPVLFLLFSDMDRIANAVHQPMHHLSMKRKFYWESVAIVPLQSNDIDFWNIVVVNETAFAAIADDGIGGSVVAAVVAGADDDHSFGRHAIV